ncbi:MAG: hypothetical protein KA586_05315 [Candidatus Promineofilum sp.]|nr:hypothetical protein [Promineifilum sp.]
MSLQSKSEDNTPWGCIGTVLAALIIGGITIWLQLRTEAPVPTPSPTFFPTPSSTFFPTPVPTIQDQNQDLASVTIINTLQHDVKIYVGEEYDGEINALSTEVVRLDKEPVDIKFIAEKETLSDGTPIGDDMSGTFYRVFEGERLRIDYVIDDKYYFYPILNNYSDMDCTVIVNDGHKGEKNAGIIRAGRSNVHIGYYRWYRDSNVTFYCGEQHWWWGKRNGEGSNSMNDLIVSEDASVIFTLDE